MLIVEQKLVLYGKTTSAALGKCSRFHIRYNIAKDSLSFYKIKLCRSLCVELGFQFVVDEVS